MLIDATLSTSLAEAYADVERSRQHFQDVLRQIAHPPVQPYLFTGSDGTQVTLSGLFGDRADLIVIHNMGTSCAYCTMWADGLNGVLPYLEDRAAFVVISPDMPEVQARFAAKRGWRFRMASSAGTTFCADMGFEHDGSAEPGVTTFHRQADGTITIIGQDMFGPGDVYSSPWHLFDLLEGGAKEWEPNYNLPTATPQSTITAQSATLEPLARDGVIDALATVCLFVTDQDRAKTFYTEVLGFEVRQDSPMGPSRWLAVAPPGARTELILYQMDGNWDHYQQVIGKSQPITFNVRNTTALLEDLRAKGATIVEGPTVQPWGTFTIIQDQDENKLILVEPPSVG